MRDMHNNIAPVVVRAPASPATTGVKSGTVIDMQGFRSVEFLISSGAQTTAGITVTPIVKHGEATGSLASAADADLLGTEAAAASGLAGAGGANSVQKVGYVGNKRYVTVDLDVAGGATGIYGVVAVKGEPMKAPK